MSGSPKLPARFFETTRLIFRPFDPDDLDALAEICADRDVQRYVEDGQPMGREMTALWIEKSRENVARHGTGTGAVLDRSTCALIGWAGIARPPDASPEIIYGLAKDRWGEGLGRELLTALIPWAHTALGPTLHATVDTKNAASIRLLASSGFTLTTIFTEDNGSRTGAWVRDEATSG